MFAHNSLQNGIEALLVFDRIEAMQTPFVLGPHDSLQSLSLTLDASMAPFFVNFVLLKSSTTAQDEDIWIR